jgi:uncharacterized protein (TIGR03067 family)
MQDELRKLQGVWAVTSLELDGAPLGDAAFSTGKIAVEGNNFTSTGMGAIYRGTLEIDVAKRPRSLNMKFTDGPEKGNTNRGIYELEGDTWKPCLSTTGGPAPTKFATSARSGCALETLRREKQP